MKNKIILTVGPTSSGKSTFAKMYARSNKNVFILNRDDIRLSLFGLETLKQYQHSIENEHLVTIFQMDMAKTIVRNNNMDKFGPATVIVADTNLNVRVRFNWNNLARYNGCDYELFYNWGSLCTDGRVSKDCIEIPVEELRRRNELRIGNKVPENVLVRQVEVFSKFLSGDKK